MSSSTTLRYKSLLNTTSARTFILPEFADDTENSKLTFGEPTGIKKWKSLINICPLAAASQSSSGTREMRYTSLKSDEKDSIDLEERVSI